MREIPDPYEDVSLSRVPPTISSATVNRTTVERRRRAAITIALLLETAWIAGEGFAARSELGASFVVAGFGFPLLGAGVAWLVFSRPGRLGLGLSHRRVAAGIATAIVLFGVSALFAPPSAMRMFTVSSTFTCATTAVLLGAVLFTAGVFAYRGMIAGSAWLRMAAFGVACGSLAAFILRLHCPGDSILHVLLGHGAAMLVFGLLGATAARRTMRV